MTPDEFERVLDRACDILTENVRSSTLYHGPEPFEQHVQDMLKVAAKDTGFTVSPTFNRYAFPDIRVNGYGVEVKYTKQDTWTAVGNSIFEGMRDPDVHSIYVVLGKIGGTPEVRWGRYEDAVTHVRVSNSPRFVIELETERAPLFSHMAIPYGEFAQLGDEAKMRHVRDYSRGRLKEGERLWWLEPEHSLPLQVRPYPDLPDAEKRVLRAEAALLSPQICGPSHGRTAKRKYAVPALYLLMHHGVIAPQTRDLFSAGSVAQHIPPLYEGEPHVSRALRGIEDLMRDAAERLDDALFEEYWGRRCPPEERIAEWLRMADAVAKSWRPSDHLFLAH